MRRLSKSEITEITEHLRTIDADASELEFYTSTLRPVRLQIGNPHQSQRTLYEESVRSFAEYYSETIRLSDVFVTSPYEVALAKRVLALPVASFAKRASS